MTKSRNFKRALAVITVLAMVICLAQTVVFASNTVDVKDGSYNAANSEITVTGSISTKGAEMTMLAVRTDDPNVALSSYATPDALAAAVQYIDQVSATDDNFEKTWTFALRDGGSGDYVVVFVSGTDAEVKKLAIELAAKTGVNGTVTFEAGSDFVEDAPTFTLAGGDDDWAGQLVGTVKDAEGTEVDADFDFAARTITMTAPFEKTSYTATITNSNSDDYAAYTATKTFTLVSDAGNEFANLPADLGVTVADGDDAYTITVPEDTENITYTVTVDGEEVADRPVVVDRAEEGGDNKTVVVSATADGAATPKTKTVTVLAKGASSAISDDAIEVLKDDPYEATGKSLIVVDTDAVDPATQSMTVAGEALYYSPQKGKFYGVVDTASIADVNNIVIEETPSENFYFGVVVTAGPEMKGKDFTFAGRASLGNEQPTFKQYIAMDVNTAEPDGKYVGKDFTALGRHSLGADLPVLAQ